MVEIKLEYLFYFTGILGGTITLWAFLHTNQPSAAVGFFISTAILWTGIFIESLENKNPSINIPPKINKSKTK